MEIKELNEALENMEKGLKKMNEEKAATFTADLDALKAAFAEYKSAGEEASKELAEGMQKQFDALAAKMAEPKKGASRKSVSFGDVLAEGIEESKEVLTKAAKVGSSKSKFNHMVELKAVGDMSFTNFGEGAYEAATTEVRQSLFTAPYSPLWLRNVLPAASTDSAAIQYLRENGGEGAAAIWDETAAPLANKPQVDHDFELVTEQVDWIAGYTRIHRSMLEDISFLRTYLPNQLIYGPRGLFVAENSLIYSTLTSNAVAYDGSKTIPVEMLYDAALGQIRDNYYAASHILVNNRDYVSLIALNKASGSGEYDLPQGAIQVSGGSMTLGGVPVIGVPNIPAGEFVVLDNRATQFVSRMSPEVMFSSEDRDNFVKNLVTIRAEERAAVLVFDSNAVITGEFGS